MKSVGINLTYQHFKKKKKKKDLAEQIYTKAVLCMITLKSNKETKNFRECRLM